MHNSTSPRTRLLISLGLVVALTFLFFRPILGYDFLLSDDEPNIYRNAGVTSLHGAAFWQWSLTDIETSLRYKPVTWWVFHGLWTLFGANAGAFHACSLLLHLVNTCLVYVVIRRAFARELGNAADGVRWLAPLLITLAWAVHPLRAEPIAWAAQLSYPLAAFFILCASLGYENWRSGAGGRIALLAAYLFYLLALGTYPIVLTCGGIVAVDLILDRWRDPVDGVRRSTPARWLALGAVLLPAIAVLTYTVHGIAHYTAGYWTGDAARVSLSWNQAAMGVENLCRYFWLELWPWRAEIFQGFHATREFTSGGFMLAAGIALAFIVYGFSLRGRDAKLRLLRWSACFVLVCLPSLGLTIPNYVPALKNHYLSGIVVAVGACGLILSARSVYRQWLGLAFVALALIAGRSKFQEILTAHRDSNAYFARLELDTDRRPDFDRNIVAFLRARGAYHAGDYATAVRYYTQLDLQAIAPPCLAEYAVALYIGGDFPACAAVVDTLAVREKQPADRQLAQELREKPESDTVKNALIGLSVRYGVIPRQ